MNESNADRAETLAVCLPSLPLAIYREVAAHLSQVSGIAVELVPQRSTEFDYSQSQIGGLSLRYTAEANAESRQRVQQILAYYGDRYGNWQPLEG